MAKSVIIPEYTLALVFIPPFLKQDWEDDSTFNSLVNDIISLVNPVASILLCYRLWNINEKTRIIEPVGGAFHISLPSRGWTRFSRTVRSPAHVPGMLWETRWQIEELRVEQCAGFVARAQGIPHQHRHNTDSIRGNKLIILKRGVFFRQVFLRVENPITVYYMYEDKTNQQFFDQKHSDVSGCYCCQPNRSLRNGAQDASLSMVLSHVILG